MNKLTGGIITCVVFYLLVIMTDGFNTLFIDGDCLDSSNIFLVPFEIIIKLLWILVIMILMAVFGILVGFMLSDG